MHNSLIEIKSEDRTENSNMQKEKIGIENIVNVLANFLGTAYCPKGVVGSPADHCKHIRKGKVGTGNMTKGAPLISRSNLMPLG